MKTHAPLTNAGRQYEAAYDAHYSGHDLSLALHLYREVMAAHPDDQEAGYSRTQIQNIISAVVPKQELLDAQLQLAYAHLERQSAPAVAPLDARSVGADQRFERVERKPGAGIFQQK